jgi:hypothetical protein
MATKKGLVATKPVMTNDGQKQSKQVWLSSCMWWMKLSIAFDHWLYNQLVGNQNLRLGN